MAYRVRVLPRAERDFEGIYISIHAEDVVAARKWYLGFREAILTLEKFPKRCAVTRESRELRHLLYGKKPHVYRAIFRIVERSKEVQILHVRHGAQDEFEADDLG